MRINRFIAQSTGISRRAADKLIQGSKVFINGIPAQLSDHATANDKVVVDKKQIFLPASTTTILINKPAGYVCSRDGQGSKTVYDLLPEEFKNLKTIGRLDKDSSGLLVMSDDGLLAHELTHPKYSKEKIYLVHIAHPLKGNDFDAITKHGVVIGDGRLSTFKLAVQSPEHKAGKNHATHDSCFAENTQDWIVTIHEGRNRQIRRTFSALGYSVTSLHRITFGNYKLSDIALGEYKKV